MRLESAALLNAGVENCLETPSVGTRTPATGAWRLLVYDHSRTTGGGVKSIPRLLLALQRCGGDPTKPYTPPSYRLTHQARVQREGSFAVNAGTRKQRLQFHKMRLDCKIAGAETACCHPWTPQGLVYPQIIQSLFLSNK